MPPPEDDAATANVTSAGISKVGHLTAEREGARKMLEQSASGPARSRLRNGLVALLQRRDLTSPEGLMIDSVPLSAAFRRRSPWVIGGVLVLALVVLFGMRGCSGTVIDAGGIKVLVAGYQSGGSDALGGGSLDVVGGCLGADGDVYVFPQGTEVVAEKPLTIDIPGVGEVSLGEEFGVGGGYAFEHSSDHVEPGPIEIGGVTVPAECAEYDIFLSAPR
jgi:hypothetical protein